MNRRIHVSTGPVAKLVPREQKDGAYKPRGLWYSIDDEWERWCNENNYGGPFTHRYVLDVSVSRMLLLQSVDDIDCFSADFGDKFTIDWHRVAKLYDGIEIAPYQYDRRFSPHTHWYYGWDVASGCIWNPRVIRGMREEIAFENGGLRPGDIIDTYTIKP